MKTITLADKMEEGLDLVPGKDLQEKFSKLIENTIVLHLRECEDYLFKYESKYRMDFTNFEEHWGKGDIPDKHSH